MTSIEQRVHAFGHYVLMAIAVASVAFGMFLIYTQDSRDPILIPPCAVTRGSK
jgi:formate hydrogenlyase subunit 3/multisubunit Na+/H+ antiporter MnhD subunit